MSVSSRPKRNISQSGRKGNSSMAIWLIGGAILFVILIVVAININNARPVATTAQPDLLAEWLVGSSMGNPEAKVVVDAYEDFLCSHCLEWTNTVKQQLVENYVKPGKVRFVYHTFPLSGFAPGSTMAAMASQCAEDQGAFWPFHDRLFNAQRDGQPAFTLEKLVEYAAELSLNESDFTRCMSSQAHQADIEATMQEAISKGVGGTPALFVNGASINSDYPALQAEIDRLLGVGG